MPLCRLSDVSLSYMWLGEDRTPDPSPVVLVHGLGASFGFWYPAVAPILAQNRRVLLFDLRGHGRSSIAPTGYTLDRLADDLSRLFDALDIGASHVVGHSFGAAVALQFAVRNRALIKSLTIVDSRIRALQPQAASAGWRAGLRYRDVLAKFDVDFDPDSGEFGVDLLTKMAQLRLHRPETMEELATLVPSPFVGVRGKVAAERWLNLITATSASSDIMAPDPVAADDIARLELPVLLVYGEHSHAMTSATEFLKLCGSAQLVIVHGAGHFFPLTRPNALLEPLQHFLDALGRADYDARRKPMLTFDA
jgi:pimeloyl-ACP methyl ester carboxylesterase